jgi:hypothetical protein
VHWTIGDTRTVLTPEISHAINTHISLAMSLGVDWTKVLQLTSVLVNAHLAGMPF